MDQKIAFIREWESGQFYFNSLCQAYGISRQTGYKLIKRYQNGGLDALLEQSKKPIHSPNASSNILVQVIKKWRTKKGWGAKKIRVKLVEQFGLHHTPSVTTIHNILIRLALVKPKKVRRKVKPSFPCFDPKHPNEIWSADYKGSFLLGNRKRCYPITICDSFSRFIIDIQGQYRENSRNVKKVLTKAFKTFGKPKILHTDNGAPFASIQSPCGYGALSYWLIDHGITPVFSDPGRPDQNGRHERMHRDLKQRCCKPPAFSLRAQNRKMNAFTHEYNFERPHENLGMNTPASIHKNSKSKWNQKVKNYQYDHSCMVRKVSKNGAVRWGSYEWIYISRALFGRYIAIKKLPNRVHQVFYRNCSLGYFLEGELVQKGRYYLIDADKDLKQRKNNGRK